MKKLAVLAAVMLAAASPVWCKVGDKLVLEMNATVNSTTTSGGSYSDGITKYTITGSDQLSVSFSGKQIWNVVDEDEGYLILEEVSCSSTRSGGGAGSGSSKVVLLEPINGRSLCSEGSGSWNYTVPNTDNDTPLPTPEITLKKGEYKIPQLYFFGNVTGSGKGKYVQYKLDGSSEKTDADETGGPCLMWLATEAIEEAYHDKAFLRTFEGSIAPDSKSFSVSQTANYTLNKRLKHNDAPTHYTQGNAKVQVQYTLSFNYTPEEIEAVIVPPVDYIAWMPKGGSNEKAAGNSTVARVELYVKGQPGKRPKSRAKFRVQLSNTSKEPGVCLNYPVSGATEDYDMKIDPAENTEFQVSEGGQSATSKEYDYGCGITLSSYDWGAYGKLKVTAITEKGQSIEATVKGIGGNELVLPMDKNGNHIADAWEKAKMLKNTAADSDDETSKGNNKNGDGYSLYEEYRGMMTSTAAASHKYLNPTSKDIAVENFPGGVISAGLALFESAAGMKIIELKPGMLRSDRVANANSRYKHNGDQYGLRIKPGTFAKSYDLAMAMPSRQHPSPKDCTEILLRNDYVSAYSDRTVAQKSKNEIRAAFTTAVPHEIAHALSVQHHGDDSELPKVELQSYSPAEVYDVAGKIKSKPITLENIGSYQGAASGNASCLMSYLHCTDWAHNKMSNSFRQVPKQTPGSIFCTSSKGTGINAGGAYFGDCGYGRGNCLSRMQVKDY